MTILDAEIRIEAQAGPVRGGMLNAELHVVNLAKSNRDQTDFRDNLGLDAELNCAFCQVVQTGTALLTNVLAVAFNDKYPVTPGHCLIAPRRHTADFFTMATMERQQ